MNHTPLPPLVAVVGPTASGKSALAMALAERLGGEVINTDSMQVYRGFDIGTGKLSQAERRRVTHHLIDVANPAEQYSAGRYVADARAAIAGVVERGRVPILCGGTGLYFRALLFGMAEIPQVSARVRDAVEAWLKQKGLAAGHAELTRVDPVTAAKVHPNDPARIARALEVYRMAGVPLSAYRRAQPFAESAPGALSVGTSFERPELYRRIGQRVRAMIARGWIEEVEGLLGQGYGPGLKPMRAIGYRQSMIQLMFLLESSFVALLGVAIGVALGTIVSFNLVKDFQDELEGIRFTVPWIQIIIIIAVAYVFSMLATYLPARQAGRIHPAEALRYE